MAIQAKTFAPISVDNCAHRIIERPASLSPLGHRGRLRRYNTLCERVASRKTLCVSRLSDSEAERRSYSRLLNTDGVSNSDWLDFTCFKSLSSSRPELSLVGRHILSLADGSNLDCSGAAGRIARNGQDLGVLNNNKTPGMIAHASLAFDLGSGRIIGLADLILFNRPRSVTPLHSHRNNSSLSRKLKDDQKESYAWRMGADHSREMLLNFGCQHLTHVLDADADSLSLFDYLLKKDRCTHQLWNGKSIDLLQEDFVIRAQYRNRKVTVVTDQNGKRSYWLKARENAAAVPEGVKTTLLECLENEPFSEEVRTVRLKAYNYTNKRTKKRKRRARTAKIRQRRIKVNYITAQGTVHQLYFVQAAENANLLTSQDRPSAVDWIIITNAESVVLKSAWLIVDIYRKRWHIEQLFRTLKKQGYEQARVQMGSLNALIRIVALAMETSARVLRLVQAREAEEGYLLEDEFEEKEIKILIKFNAYYEGKTAKQKNPFPPDQLSYAVWIIAKMGGYPHYSSKPPGPIIIARGLQRFLEFVELDEHINN